MPDRPGSVSHPQLDAVIVEDGLEVVKLCERDPESADIILLDANMGGGDRDGVPTMRRLAALYAERGLPLPPLVMLSGETDPDTVAEFSVAGATRVLTKPATLQELKTLVGLAHKTGALRERSARTASTALDSSPRASLSIRDIAGASSRSAATASTAATSWHAVTDGYISRGVSDAGAV